MSFSIISTSIFFKLVIILTLAQYFSVNTQLTLTCFYDNQIYTTETSVQVSEAATGACKESYAYSSDATKYIVLTFTNINIACLNANNNLRILTANQSYTFCPTTSSSLPSTYTFASKSNYVAIQKFNEVSFILTTKFPSSHNPCQSAPCLNGGTCTVVDLTYTCSCTSLFYGLVCELGVPTCVYDDKLYSIETTVTDSKTSSTTCQESYAYSTVIGKVIVLEFTNVNVDCSVVANNLRLVSDSITYSFCQRSNTAVDFVFSTKTSRWVAIQKIGLVSFTLNVRFVSNYVPNCGVPLIQPSLSSNNKIVGGTEAVKNGWPWQVLISDGRSMCGASLINSQWLVTAAHCRMRVSTLYAYLGDHNIYNQDGETKIKVTQFIPHPFYISNSAFDVALMKLEYEVLYTDKIVPICLPDTRDAPIGSLGIVTGWGLTSEGGSVSAVLNQVSVSILNDNECGSNPITDICAGQFSPVIRDSCQGDSGGPLVIKDTKTNTWYLSGIVSRGAGCRGRGVYAKVSVFQTWITDTMLAYSI